MTDRPGLDDDALGRLLAEGVGRSADGPVDDGELLSGARRGAARIRRRRRTVLTVASVLVIGSPVGLVVSEFMRPTASVTSASSVPMRDSDGAAPGSAPEAVAGGAPDAGSAPAWAQSSASPGAPGSERTAAGQNESGYASSVTGTAAPTSTDNRKATGSKLPGPTAALPTAVVPAGAMLTAADLPKASLRPVSDIEYAGEVPLPAAADTCGIALTGAPGSAYGRAAVLESPGAATAGRWSLGSTVRVFAADGADTYVGAASRSGCVASVVAPGADQALLGSGRPDAAGRVHWYAAARVGRVVTEVSLLAPRGSGIGRSDVLRLLTSAATRATSSGLAPSAAADPALA